MRVIFLSLFINFITYSSSLKKADQQIFANSDISMPEIVKLNPLLRASSSDSKEIAQAKELILEAYRLEYIEKVRKAENILNKTIANCLNKSSLVKNSSRSKVMACETHVSPRDKEILEVSVVREFDVSSEDEALYHGIYSNFRKSTYFGRFGCYLDFNICYLSKAN